MQLNSVNVYDYEYPKKNYVSAPVQRTNGAKLSSQKPLHRSSTGVVKNGFGDSFEYRNIQRRKNARQKKTRRIWRNRIIGALTAASMTAGGIVAVENIASVNKNFDGMGHTITEIAQWTNVDTDAILLANGLDDENVAVNDIVLPELYSPEDEKIEKYTKLLSNGKLDDEKKEYYSELLDEALAQKELQDKLATVYKDKDNKYAYIIPKSDTSVEKIKNAFGIEDGVIKKYNNISYTWKQESQGDIIYSYKDYSGAAVPDEGIKVPLKAIDSVDE